MKSSTSKTRLSNETIICEGCSLLFRVKYLIDGPELVYRRQAQQLKDGSANYQMCKMLYDWLPRSDEDDEKVRGMSYQLLYPYSAPNKDVIKYGLKVS